jgi:hypothetical protein
MLPPKNKTGPQKVIITATGGIGEPYYRIAGEDTGWIGKVLERCEPEEVVAIQILGEEYFA